MNKTIISWTHYIYVTITASVLAYVTVMDSSDEEDDSAINMLSNIDTTSNSQSPEDEEQIEAELVNEEPIEAELVQEEPIEAELVQEEPIEAELVEEIPTQQSKSGSSGGKLKKNKTKTNSKHKKANHTRSRK
jgi:hypothetical protein